MNPVDQPESPRGMRWIATQPYASLLFCVACIALQVVSWAVLFLVGVKYHRNEVVSAALNVPMFLWILLPAASLYGIYLARPSSGYDRPGGWLRGLGLLANLLYLMIGMFIWLMGLSGVRV
jgi:hypothetical protein